MRKWNIKFSGSPNDDPDAFLTRIEEGRELVPVSDMNILRVIPFFLSGIALIIGSAVQNIYGDYLINSPRLLELGITQVTFSNTMVAIPTGI